MGSCYTKSLSCFPVPVPFTVLGIVSVLFRKDGWRAGEDSVHLHAKPRGRYRGWPYSEHPGGGVRGCGTVWPAIPGSVADPHVFGPPGSGSIIQRYGSWSGSFYHHANIVRKTLIVTILWLFLTFSLWKMMWMYLQKVTRRKCFY